MILLIPVLYHTKFYSKRHIVFSECETYSATSLILNQMTRTIRFFWVNQNALRDQSGSILQQMTRMTQSFSVNQNVLRDQCGLIPDLFSEWKIVPFPTLKI